MFDQLASQDSAAVTATLKDVLTGMKQEMPHIDSVYIRSDNAGCYHSITTMATLAKLNKESSGIKVLRWDFSEPQQGKDACDRYAAVVKRKVRQYVIGQQKCQTAAEFQAAAFADGGSPGVTIARGTLSQETVPKAKIRIPGISFLNNFQFSENGDIVVWKAYRVGPGKIIPFEKLENGHSESTFEAVEVYHQAEKEELGKPPTTNQYWKPLTRKYKQMECPISPNVAVAEDEGDKSESECPDALEATKDDARDDQNPREPISVPWQSSTPLDFGKS